MLSNSVLLPVHSKIPNPLSAMFLEFETKASNEEEWLKTAWLPIKKALILRCLRKAHGIFFLKGFKSPSELVQDAISEMYQAVNGSAYFSLEYRQAFFYWLKNNSFNSKYPQFKEEEVFTALGLLSEDEIKEFAVEALKEGKLFKDRVSAAVLFKTIQRSLYFLSKSKRLGTLFKRDPAIYSSEDLCQQLNLKILLSLKNADQINCNEFAWAITIAKNALRDMMLKSKIHEIKTEQIEQIDESVLDVVYELDAEDKCFFDSLMQKAEPRIQAYLRFLFGEESPEFWEWFSFNEPELSQREVYKSKQPQAVLPWVQRWLNLGNWELLDFFKIHYPELISNPRRRA